MTKAQKLQQVADEIEQCHECKEGKTGMAVPGEGNPDAEIMFIGEAPGNQEAKTGRPFIGRSGTLLRSQIRLAGLSEEEVYITSPVKYLPLRGTPSKTDIIHGTTHLRRQITIIDPKIMVLLGRVATLSQLEGKISIVKQHGTIIKQDGNTYFISYHPSAAIRFKAIRIMFEKDFQKLKEVVKKT